MSADGHQLISRFPVRATMLASALVVAMLGLNAAPAGAATTRSSNSGVHVGAASKLSAYRGTSSKLPIYRSTTSAPSTYRPPLRSTKPNWATSSPPYGSHNVRPPPNYGTYGNVQPRPPLRWPHRRPILIAVPTLPAGPTSVVVAPSGGMSPPRRNGPSGGGGVPGGGGTPNVAAVNESFVPDEVLVRFAASASQQAIASFAGGQRLALIGVHRLPENAALYRFRITDRRQVPTVVASARGDARVAAVQPNYLYRVQDARGATVQSHPMQYVVSKLRLPEAHALAAGERVLVAVIDTGIDGGHAELRGAVAGSFDTVKGERGASIHGTQMASAIAARGQLLGVAPAARVLAVRAFDDAPSGSHGTTARLVDALTWVANAGARVVNMSFAGTVDDPSVHAWITAIRRKGIVLVAAAGNNGPNAPPAYPAAFPEVIAVTATDADDRLLRVANRGTYVSVAAPGVDIYVAVPGGGYDFTTGTSVAAAHVSGLAALLIARNPGLTADAVQAILMRTARDLGLKGRDSDFGAGVVDAYEALLSQPAATTAERSRY
jgi:subtilisin family serine protease